MKRLLAFLLLSASAFSQTVTSLWDVKTIFVEKMDKNLDVYLRQEIAKKFPRTPKVVENRKEADAILILLKPNPEDIHTITVNLTDAGGVAVLWSGSSSDRFLMKKNDEGKIAQRLVGQLKKTLHK